MTTQECAFVAYGETSGEPLCVCSLASAQAWRGTEYDQARLQHWEDPDVHLFYLPTSPHLNKIETLWRQIKYEWLRRGAYANFKTLKTAVWHILDRVGLKYTIQFAP